MSDAKERKLDVTNFPEFPHNTKLRGAARDAQTVETEAFVAELLRRNGLSARAVYGDHAPEEAS